MITVYSIKGDTGRLLWTKEWICQLRLSFIGENIRSAPSIKHESHVSSSKTYNFTIIVNDLREPSFCAEFLIFKISLFVDLFIWFISYYLFFFFTVKNMFQVCLLSREAIVITMVVMVLLMMKLTLTAVVFRYRWHIRLLLYEVFRGTGQNPRQGYHFRYGRDGAFELSWLS